MTRAVIDVGSNSVLLTVAKRDGDVWQSVTETSRVTGLGRGTKQTGLLSEAGITDTLAALWDAFIEAREHGADEITAAATMAARIAKNADEFLAKAAAQRTPVSILSGEEEADLGLQAVATDPMFASYPRISIIDPGGHSTELVTADLGRVLFRRSYPVGTLGLRGGILADEAPGPRARLEAVREFDETIGLEYLPGTAGRAVVLGATGTNLISIRERMVSWQPDLVHGATLDYEEVGRAVGWLCEMTDSQRAAIVGMEPGREGTIHIGALILERFLHALHVLDCSVSVRGWRHALLEREVAVGA